MGQTKQPSAAEVARRETVAAKTGQQPTGWDVTVDSIQVRVTADSLDDFDIVDQLQQNNVQPILKAWFGGAYRQRLKPLEDTQGHLKVSRVLTWVGDVFEAVGAKNS